MGGFFPDWLNSKLPYYSQQDNETAEWYRKIKEKASRYDAMVNLVGYHEFLNVMMLKIQSEITEATKVPLQPETQRIHVIRWNAMRELLDAAQNDVIDIQKERDRINKEELEYLKAMNRQNEPIEDVV